ncbi:hypothetical protein CDAR_312961 [Caerostris darwini]|uniref:Uncharacterized protein n=1 Tax=Caerostris darwini TaxID=1538125 RepID=A0AAV4S0T3_9ARAC|nr:hypothetical protein CDAR_312961 [Caerostris darwini]
MQKCIIGCRPGGRVSVTNKIGFKLKIRLQFLIFEEARALKIGLCTVTICKIVKSLILGRITIHNGYFHKSRSNSAGCTGEYTKATSEEEKRIQHINCEGNATFCFEAFAPDHERIPVPR